MKNVQLRTERLTIRDILPRDAARVAEFHRDNQHFHGPWEPTRPETYYSDSQQRRILRAERRADDLLHLWMVGREQECEGALIGSVTLSVIVRGYLQSSFLGYKLDSRYTRRGYMREALTCVVDHAFGPLGLHRLEANVMPANDRSLKLLGRLGFVSEGTARSYLKIRGRWEDHVHMVLLAEDREKAGG